MSKKSCPVFTVFSVYKIGQDFFDIWLEDSGKQKISNFTLHDQLNMMNIFQIRQGISNWFVKMGYQTVPKSRESKILFFLYVLNEKHIHRKRHVTRFKSELSVQEVLTHFIYCIYCAFRSFFTHPPPLKLFFSPANKVSLRGALTPNVA